MAITSVDSWNELALIQIAQKGGGTGAIWHFQGIADEITVTQGARPGSGKPNLGGGRIWVDEPQEDGEITLKLYPLSNDTAAGNAEGLFQQYVGGTYDTAQPLVSGATNARRYSKDQFRVVILCTNDTAITAAATPNAGSQNAAGKDAFRVVVTSARITDMKLNFNPSEGLTADVTISFPPFSKSGLNNYYEESASNQTAQISDLTGAYS